MLWPPPRTSLKLKAAAPSLSPTWISALFQVADMDVHISLRLVDPNGCKIYLWVTLLSLCSYASSTESFAITKRYLSGPTKSIRLKTSNNWWTKSRIALSKTTVQNQCSAMIWPLIKNCNSNKSKNKLLQFCLPRPHHKNTIRTTRKLKISKECS